MDRLGERIVLTSGLLIVATSSVIAGFSQTYLQLVAFRGIGGIGSSMFTVSALALLTPACRGLKPARDEPQAPFQGAVSSWVGLPAQPLGGIVVAISIRAPFFVYAAALFMAAMLSPWCFLSRAQLLAREEASRRGPRQPKVARAYAGALKDKAYQAALGTNLVYRVRLIRPCVARSCRSSWSKGWSEEPPSQALASLQPPPCRQSGPAPRRPHGGHTRPAQSPAVRDHRDRLLGMVVLTLADAAVNGLGQAAMLGNDPVLGEHGDPRLRGRLPWAPPPQRSLATSWEARKGGIVVATFQMMSDVGAVAGPLACRRPAW